MAAPSESDASAAKKYVDYDEYVDFQIEKARSHIKATDIFTTLTTLVAAFVGYLLVFVVCDQWLLADGFSDWARTALLSIVVLGIGVTLVRNVAIPVIRRVHPLYAARMIERSDPKLQSNLLNFVDLQEASDSSAAPSVVRAMQKRAAVELSNIDVDEAIDRRPLLRVAYVLLAVVVVSALYIVFSPKDPFTSVRRALFPRSSIAVATETTIGEVTPGDDRVPARTKLTIEADVRGPHADRAQILFTTSDHKEVNQPVEMRRVDPDLPRYRGVLNGENGRGLLQSLTYAIVAGDARTRDFHIEVVQPPSARVDDVHLAFPTYMQFEERTTPGGNIDGWEGATVTVRATANLPLKSATIVMIDNEDPHAKGEEIAMQVSDGTKLSAKWKLEFRSDGTCPHFYYLQVKTAKGEVDPEPTVHPLRIRPDQRPEVALISPAGDLTGERARPANAKIPLLIQAADPDFLLRSIRLKAERNGEEIVNEPLFENRDLGQAIRGSHDWNLGQVRPPLRPGETIQFWIEARDNKQPTANRAVTPRVNLEIRPEKSADEVQKDLAAEKQQQADQLARADETKNDGGSGRQPRQDDPQGENTPPPDRPAPNASPRREEPTPAANDRDTNEPNGEPKSDPRSGENRSRRPQPAGDDPQKTLERLLQKQQAEEQPKPEEEPTKDRQEEQQSSDDPKQEQRERGPQKKKSAGDKGAGKSADQDEGGKDSAAQKKQSSKKEEGGSDRIPQPGEGKRQEGSAAKKKDKPGESSSKNDKAGDDGSRDAKDASKPDRSKSADPAGKESPDKKSPDNKSPEEKSAAEKSPGKGTDEKPAGANKTGDKDSGDQREKGAPDESEPSPEKTNDDSGASSLIDRDKEKPGPASPDDPDKPKRDSPNSDASKPPTDPGQPSSDGDGNDKEAQNGGDSDKGKKAESHSNDDDDAKAGAAEQPDKGPDSKSPSRDKKSDADDTNGAQEPADDAERAKKKKGAVKDPKEATGSDEKDPDATRRNDIERKPGSKPGAMKPSEKKDADAQEPGERRKEKAGNNSATDDAKKAKRAADGKKDVEESGANDDPSSEKPDQKQSPETEKQPGESPELGNQDQKGEGRKKGQKSEQSQGGEKGKSGASDQGEKGSNNEGPGDQGDQPGESENAKGKTGKSGQDSGKGSSTKPSEKGSPSKSGDQGKPGNKGGQGDGSESGEGEGESSKSAGKSEKGKPGDKPANKSGSTSPSQPGKPSGGQSSSSEGGGVDGSRSSDDGAQDGDGAGDGKGLGEQGAGGDSVPSAEEEQARLDYAKKATNLLLKRLKDQLSRGEIDQKMLDEMGWKDAGDVAKFTQYLENNLNNANDETKRLQFEEMLKSMRLGNETIQRKGGEGRERRVESVDRRTAPAPPEYRQQWEDYNKRIGSKRDKGGTKAAPSGKK